MKAKLLLFFCCAFYTSRLIAQSPIDSSLSKQDDYYCWLHPTFNKSPKRTVSKFATYSSVGFGLNTVKNMIGGCILFSQTFAYKSWLLTYTQAGAANFALDPTSAQYTTSYVALLLGQSVRGKHSLISLSAGFGYTTLNIDWVDIPSSYKPSKSELYLFHKSLYGFYPSIPIEIKFFALAPNFVGGGLHLCYDIILSKNAFPSFYLGYELTVGKWNKLRHPFPSSQYSLKMIKVNHFAPFHNKKPTSNAERTVSILGNYLYFGLGNGVSSGFKVNVELVGYSIAYKSHILTFNYSNMWYYGSHKNFYDVTKAIMIGESYRFQYGMAALSSGIGRTRHSEQVGGITNSYYLPDKNTTVIPLELKLIIHFYNFLGGGIVLSSAFKPQEKAAYYAGFSIVAGFWNKWNRYHWL